MLKQDYSKVFNELFFDTGSSQQVKDVLEEVDAIIGCLIIKFIEVLNEILLGDNRQDEITDIVIVLFIRKIIEQLDAINILMSAGSFKQSQVILRSLIETSVSLEFILKDDTRNRAANYFLERHYQDFEVADKYYKDINQLGELFKNTLVEENFKEIQNKVDNKRKAFAKIIASKSIFQQIERCRAKKINDKKRKLKRKKVNIQWYEVCSSINNFYELMEDLGYQNYYKGIYGGFSNEVHALNATMEIEVSLGGINLKSIRNLEHGDSALLITSSFSLSALTAVYSYLGDGIEEKKEFKDFLTLFVERRDNVIKNLKTLY